MMLPEYLPTLLIEVTKKIDLDGKKYENHEYYLTKKIQYFFTPAYFLNFYLILFYLLNLNLL